MNEYVCVKNTCTYKNLKSQTGNYIDICESVVIQNPDVLTLKRELSLLCTLKFGSSAPPQKKVNLPLFLLYALMGVILASRSRDRHSRKKEDIFTRRP